MMIRGVIRLAHGVVALVAIGVGVAVIHLRGFEQPETWAIVAAALAVLTSVFSSWSSQKLLELEEDARLPAIAVALDFERKYGLSLLRVTNSGGSPARDISLTWDNPLVSSRGKDVSFEESNGRPGISVLQAGESIVKVVDGHVQFFENYEEGSASFTGMVGFKDASGRRHSSAFFMDADQYRGTPIGSDESLRTYHELQKVPAHLKRIEDQLGRIKNELSAKDT